jgi:hypothetical protein
VFVEHRAAVRDEVVRIRHTVTLHDRRGVDRQPGPSLPVMRRERRERERRKGARQPSHGICDVGQPIPPGHQGSVRLPGSLSG